MKHPKSLLFVVSATLGLLAACGARSGPSRAVPSGVDGGNTPTPAVDGGAPSTPNPVGPDATPPSTDPARTQVALLIDTSGSMEFADPVDPASGETGVQRALRALIDAHPEEETAFAVIAFGPTVVVNNSAHPTFHRNAELLESTIDSLRFRDGFSAMQDGLAAAARMIAADLIVRSAADRRRTRYEVVLVSDGTPAPTCQAGCDNDGSDNNLLPAICDAPRDQWCELLNLRGRRCREITQWLPGLSSCGAYNQPDSLVDAAGEIAAQKQRSQIASVRLHAVFLSSLRTVPPELQELAGFDYGAAVKLLSQLASTGGGSYTEVADARSLSLDVF